MNTENGTQTTATKCSIGWIGKSDRFGYPTSVEPEDIDGTDETDPYARKHVGEVSS